jgi:L-fuculose-phosphate aldolase
MVADSITRGNSKPEDTHRREICTAGRWIHARHFAPATDGNISVRLDDSRILATPTCVSKGMMTPDDLVITDLQGQLVSGQHRPSSELGMHLLIYQQRPDVHAICHAHPPIATGFAAAGIPLDSAILSEAVLSLGCVPLAPYATPGTPELCDSIAPLLRNYDAILMANHGVVTYGPDLLTAFFRMETVEHFAHVSLVTELLGKKSLLSARDVDKLLAARARYGAATLSQGLAQDVAQSSPECPETADTGSSPHQTRTRR